MYKLKDITTPIKLLETVNKVNTQYDVMPEASSLQGKVVQFVGENFEEFKTGYFYQSLETSENVWEWKVIVSGGGGADFEVGEVNTQMISTELPAEVSINKVLDDGKTKLNFDFSLPKPYKDSETGLVYSSQIAGNPVNIKNTNDGFVDKVKILNETASTISSPLTGKSVGKNLVNIANHNVVVIDYYFQDTDYNFVLKPSTTYTITFNYVVNSTTATYIEASLGYGATTSTQHELAGGRIPYPNLTSGTITKTITTPATFNVAIPKLFVREARTETIASFNVSISNVQLVLGSTASDFEPYTETAFSIPLKNTSGTELDLNPADVIEMIDGKYHLNDTELHDDSQDALRSIPTKQGQTNLIGDQPFTFDITELAMGIGEKKYALLTDSNGNAVMPATEADVVLMRDGKTVQYHLDKNLESGVIYDQVIRTQTDFETLIASPTWLGAKSVALVGQFVYDEPDNNGIMIPQTVKQIHGFNGAKITVTNFAFDLGTAIGGLWYDTRPTTPNYSIRDLEVSCTGTAATGAAFSNCVNLTNCTGTGTATGTGTTYGYGFYNCENLTNCTGTGIGTGAGLVGYGFISCTNLTNCTGAGSGDTGSGYGFSNCENLTNCTGTGTGASGYGFNDITYASNCRDGGSDTYMWGGTNKNIDLDTCCKTLVVANNTTLNTQ